jgi:hypothetical protein
MENSDPLDYDLVELRAGRLHKLRRSIGRALDEEDRMVPVVKCYCRSNDVLTPDEAERQKKPAFVFPHSFFTTLEPLIGREIEGRIYADTETHRVRFFLDLKDHAGFAEDLHPDLKSPWYDDSVLKE